MSAPALPSSRESSAATHGAPSGADFTSTPTVQSNLRVEREVQAAMCVLLFALPLKPVFDLDHVLEIGPLSVLSLSKMAGLAFVVCFLRYLHRARPALRLDVLHVLLFGMLALAMLSALQARSPATAWATVFRYASVVALYWALTQLLAAPAAQLRSLWTLVASCALAGGIALRGFVLEHSAVATLPHGDPNDVAFVLATTVPIAIGLVVNAYGWRPSAPWRAYAAMALAALMAATIAASVVLSLSRGALLGLAAAALFQIGLDRRHARTIFAAALVAGLAVALLVLVNPAHMFRGIQAKHKVAGANVTNRLQAWGEAVRLTAEHPFLGVGPGNFRLYSADRWQPGMHRLGVVHNTFLEIAAELGVPALCLFLGYIGLTLARLTAVVRRPQRLPGFAAALRAALIVAVVAGSFLSEQFLPPFWVLGAVAHGVWQCAANRAEPRP